jgi:gliding motility-associated-like protein
MNLNLHKPFANTVHFTVKKCALFLLFLIISPSLFAQDFAVTAIPSDETCEGNGSIALSVENAAPGATINYIVYYMGPTGTSTAVVVHNGPVPNVPGQQDGVYNVEAHQFVGGNEILPAATTQTTIISNPEPLDFTLTGKGILCGNDGEIYVEVTSGTAITYELSGADGLHIGPQASDTFTGLDNNVVYTITVNNGCVGNSKSYTLFEAIPIYQAGPAMFPDVELPACDKLTIRNDFSSTNNVPLTFPIQAKFTVTHYDGTVTIYDVPLQPGPSPLSGFAEIIADYHYDENCHYHVAFTDTCGTVTTSQEYDIDPLLNINGEMITIECNGRNIKYTVSKFVGPYTLEFVNPPAGFNPADYNAQYPGPYTAADDEIIFGDENNPLPVGSYIVKIHDQCNRTPDGVSGEIIIEIPEIEIQIIEYPATCNTGGSIEATIPGLPIGVATITVGPAEYSATYPVDVSAYITNQINKQRDKLLVGDLPVGDYFLILKDTCGREYPGKPFTIKPYLGDFASYLARPDCEVGFGTIMVSGTTFDQIEITAAPTAYSADHPLPHDVTSHINATDGALYMNQMPPGQYKFKAHNICDDDITMPPGFMTISAYTITADEYILTPHCGAFDLFINHQSTGTAFVSFNLQKWDPTLEQWTHPDTGNPYVPGTEIVSAISSPLPDRNALAIKNNQTNPNLLYPTGKYRVIKQYITFGDGADGEKSVFCTPTLYEFDYFSELTITGAVSLDCMGNSGNVQINAFGVPPLNYSIVSPTVIDNGTNNTFSGLMSGVYTVEVKDECNLTRTLTFNVAEIPSLVYVPDPEDLDSIAVCDQDGDNKETFDISTYTPIILDGQNPADVTITYHTSQNDAEQGINPIPNPTAVNTGTATIYARATHDLNADCAAITWFDLIVNPMPQLSMKEKWGGCEGEDVTIIADSGFDYYEWTNAAGTLTIIGPESITVSNEGNYTVTVRDAIGCEGSKTVEVVKSPVPVINTVTITDWTDVDNVITIIMEPTPIPGNYQYSLDNIHFQSSPTFNGLTPGQYTVYVRDEFGCGQDEFETYILTYPKFFTPNGDGINEYWRIYLAALEPDMLVYIYDRYGKLITGFDADSKGWDGTLNGSRLPATDYWFVVKRQNGQELKGHFSMIR